MSRFWKIPTLQLLFLFLIWRTILLLTAYIAPALIKNFGGKFPYFEETLISSHLPYWLWSFGNFDGVHYLRIAQDGYAYQFTQVFFPLYPLLVKIVSFVTFGNFVVAGLLVSNLTFLVGLIIFYKLVKKVLDEKSALWSCLFLLAFPTSYYFGSIYTEGLFWTIIVASFYLLLIKKIWWASLFGGFASTTRLIGVLLMPAVLSSKNLKSKAPLILIPLGLLAYMIFLQIKFDNALYFLSAQSVFGQERTPTHLVLLPQVLFRYLKILATTSGQPFYNAFFELSSTVFAFTMLFLSFKKVPKEWTIFSLLAITVPTLTGTFASMPRYILMAFPIFIGLATIKNFRAKTLILIISAILLVIATAIFTRGYWVA